MCPQEVRGVEEETCNYKQLGVVMKHVIKVLFAISLLTAVMVSTGSARTLKFAGHYPVEHPSTQFLFEAAKEVEQKTDGRVKIKVFPADQLGDYTLIFQDIMRGSVDMGQVNLPSQFDVRLEAHALPYIVKDYSELSKVYGYDSNFTAIFKNILDDKNIEFMGFNTVGLVGIGSKTELNEPFSPTSDKGVLIRIYPMKAAQIYMKSLNYRTTTINWADVYSAMQTGVCDAWIGGTPDVNYLTFKDVQNYYIAYNSIVEVNAFIMNKDLYKSLGEDGPVVKDIMVKTAAKSYALAEKQDNFYMDKMAEAGLTVIRPTPEEAKALEDHVMENVWPELYDMYGKEIFDAIKKDKEGKS